MKRKISLLLASILISAAFFPVLPAAAAGWESGIAVENISHPQTVSTDFSVQAYQNEVLRLINLERTGYSLPALTETSALNEIASIRAKESSVQFSHVRPDGSSPSALFAQYRVVFHKAGENLSYGYRTPQELVSAWTLSPEHRNNILSESFTETGIGVYLNANGKVYCAELFQQP